MSFEKSRSEYNKIKYLKRMKNNKIKKHKPIRSMPKIWAIKTKFSLSVLPNSVFSIINGKKNLNIDFINKLFEDCIKITFIIF